MQLSKERREDIISLIEQGLTVKEITELAHCSEHTIQKIRLEYRLSRYDPKLLKNQKSKLVSVAQHELLKEMAGRDSSDEDLNKLSNAVSVLQRVEREDSGKADETLKRFWDLLDSSARLTASEDIIDAEFTEIDPDNKADQGGDTGQGVF